MIFLRALNEVQRKKSLARIDFNDGESQVGFVVYFDDETFDMHIVDNVYNQKILDEDSDGAIMLESEEDVKELDFIFTKATFQTSEIKEIVHDISHKFSAEKTTFFQNIKESIFKREELEKPLKKKVVYTNYPSSMMTDNTEVKNITKKDLEKVDEKVKVEKENDNE